MIGSLVDGLLDRSIVFSFDRTGLWRHRARFVEGDLDVDLSGRVCLVTGANAGLGRSAARELARLGAETWMLVRNRTRGEEAAHAVTSETGSRRVHVEVVDVSSLRSIAAFVDRFTRQRVDVLINNAGVLPDTFQLTEDGLELTLATNLVGPFALTTRLVPRLAQSDDGRVVMVSSGGMYSQKLEVDQLGAGPDGFDGVKAYARTKRAEVVLSELWAEHYRGLPVTWSAMHPGWADTPGVKTSLPTFRRVTQLILRTPDEGADTIVWLAACRRLKGQSGLFWFDRAPQPTHLMSSTEESAAEREALWKTLHAWADLPRQSPSRRATTRRRGR